MLTSRVTAPADVASVRAAASRGCSYGAVPITIRQAAPGGKLRRNSHLIRQGGEPCAQA